MAMQKGKGKGKEIQKGGDKAKGGQSPISHFPKNAYRSMVCMAHYYITYIEWAKNECESVLPDMDGWNGWMDGNGMRVLFVFVSMRWMDGCRTERTDGAKPNRNHNQNQKSRQNPNRNWTDRWMDLEIEVDLDGGDCGDASILTRGIHLHCIALNLHYR